MWLGVPSYLYFAVAWIFRAICISLWLGVPSSFNFAVTWSSELFVFRYLYFAVAWSSEPSDLFFFCHRSRKEKKRIRDEIRLEEFLNKKMVSIICDVLCLLLTLSFSLTHAVCLVGRRASRVLLKMSLHRLRPRILFAAASRSVDAHRPSTNRTLWLPPVHQRPTSSAPSTACNSWRKAF
jgi:hypothetical protein